ncbi:RidA family protein [Pectobacterium polonicum]|nr:RidA family protein [Pectobacterium polonicum]
MIIRMKTQCKDDTCPSCVVAGDFIFLAHHSGGHEKDDVEFQVRASLNALRKTLQSVNADLVDLVQLNLYLRHRADFSKAREIFREYFTEQKFPARTTVFTDFVNDRCLCMIDGVAYKPSGT